MSNRPKQFIKADFKAQNQVKVTIKNLDADSCFIAALAIIANAAERIPAEIKPAAKTNLLSLVNYAVEHNALPTAQENADLKATEEFIQYIEELYNGAEVADKEVPDIADAVD